MKHLDKLRLYLLMLCFHTGSSKTCRIKERKTEIIADCTRIGLHDIPKYLPLNISELDLSYNNISFLGSNAFERFGFLTVLKIDYNNLENIETESFNGLSKLRWLSMKKSKFDISSRDVKRVFKPLIDLNHLDIRYNMDKFVIKSTVKYPFFGDMSNLTTLYMDLAENPVFNSSGLELLLNLRTVRFEKCYLKQMLNETLINLPRNIIAIYFHRCYSFISFVEPNFLRPLPVLKELNMFEVHIRFEDALKLLFPFTGKEMTSISFMKVVGYSAKPVFITLLGECEIVGYEENSLLAFKYPQCLEYVVFSGNRFSLAIENHEMELIVIAMKATNLKFFDLSYNAINFNDVTYCNIEALQNDSYRNEIYSNGCEVKSKIAKTYKSSYSNLRYSKMTEELNITVSMPANLTFFRLSHYMTSYAQYGLNVFVKNSATLRYLDLSYWKVSYFPDIYSVTPFNIKYLDLTGVSSMLFIHKSSVPIFQNIETAIMKDTMIDETIRKNGNVFKLFPTVEKFDISNNNVLYLDDDSFSFNTRLKNLNMANNLLSAIPKAVMSLAHLNKLDIRYNRIQTISQTLRTWLDAKSESKKIHLLIKGIGLIVSFFGLTIIIGVIFNFRWKITYWVYRNFRKAVENRLERKFRYDIYLAYADDRIQWVREVFLPRIECFWNMTVCLEDRDFSIGSSQADAIANAVAGSKHAIFIISDIYNDKAWGQYEIERVEYEKCSNYLQKIVVIVKNANVSSILHKFDNILQHLIIIDWTNDETGWDKLRMALFTESF
ncbi:unnamed protein product [Mytilus coruscus]|uniref:TIR domain-containing protein n=1 Tax=Mytilus coruscus TaxID=42192 RepID=A0A6J8AZH4_MYTCO|nr:unnamed protein product [Mytilus coruscus]